MQAPHTTTMKPGTSEPEKARVCDQLDRLLGSSYFNHGKRYPLLLKHIVQKTLEGETEELRERLIGYTIFEKSADYDTNNENVVRVTAGEIRKRLALYYQEPEHRSELRIEIPTGTYVAVFHLNKDGKEEAGAGFPAKISEGPHPETNGGSKGTPLEDHPQAYSFRRAEEHHQALATAHASSPIARPMSSITVWWRTWGIGAAAACAVLLAAWIVFAHWNKSPFDLFWEPFLESKKPAIIYAGTQSLYGPTPAFRKRMLSLIPPSEQNLPMKEWGPPPLVEGQVLTAKDIELAVADNISTDDVNAVVDVAKLLAAHRHSLELRSGSNLPFEDLRSSPVALTGAGSNYLTLDMTRNLPFFIDRTLRIRERGGQGRVWSSPLWESHAIIEDYAIVSRLLDSKTGTQVIILAGIYSCGTRAAGEFVTNPAQMRNLGTMGRDALEHKNLELVLHTTLVDCTPTSIDIVAMQSW